MLSVKSHITNGVNIDDLNKTINAVKEQPEIAKFKFNISNRWRGGGHNRTTVDGFRGAMQDMKHSTDFVMDASWPTFRGSKESGRFGHETIAHAPDGQHVTRFSWIVLDVAT